MRMRLLLCRKFWIALRNATMNMIKSKRIVDIGDITLYNVQEWICLFDMCDRKVGFGNADSARETPSK